jgi:DnaK suppressor protein
MSGSAEDLDGAAVRARLLSRRAEVEAILAQAQEAGQAVELDQQRVGRLSRMDALQGQAMALAAERRRHQELQRIAAALQRLEEDDYGYCVRCGEEIGCKRLELDPTVPTCIDCAEGAP